MMETIMNIFKCDVCGKEIKVNPKVVAVLKEDGTPEYTTVKSMNFATGEMVERTLPKTKDLEDRCYIVKLNAGPQTIQRDFCEEHYKEILPKINELWKALEKVENR